VAPSPHSQPSPLSGEPRTDRGRRTRRALLDAAAEAFGANGFHATGISDITRRAGVALGSFYTWFPSKEAIFRAVVADLSAQVRDHVAPAVRAAPGALAAERAALEAFLDFAATNQLLYRIIDEAEFVAPDSYREHYTTTAARIAERLRAGALAGELRPDVGEAEAWAIMGMNVFLGLRYGVWGTGENRAAVALAANRLIAEGLTPRGA
jgi:AcrR family transcriptional regulator